MPDAAPEIDAVYAWADGSDPAFHASLIERRQQYSALTGYEPEAESIAARRFRDAGNLRYSLRSVEKNAPWFRRIYIVTNGQVPKWLRHDGRVRIVTIDEIFPDREDLPTFNATAIQLNIPRIKGLSRYYVFMNDDYFFTKPTAPGYFFGENGLPKLPFSRFVLHPKSEDSKLWQRLLAHQADLLNARFGRRDWYESPHSPFIFDNEQIARICGMWANEIRETNRHPFRAETDLHLQIIYANAFAMLDEEKAPSERHEKLVLTDDELGFVSVGHPDMPWQSQLKKIRNRPARFLCLNDDAPENFDEVEAIHRGFLQKLFPEPSSFEDAALAEKRQASGVLGYLRRMFA